MASQHRAQEPFDLPKIESNDLFKKSLALLKRCQLLTQCLVELINVPFPQVSDETVNRFRFFGFGNLTEKRLTDFGFSVLGT